MNPSLKLVQCNLPIKKAITVKKLSVLSQRHLTKTNVFFRSLKKTQQQQHQQQQQQQQQQLTEYKVQITISLFNLTELTKLV